MSLRPRYSHSPPVLALGTLLTSSETAVQVTSEVPRANPRRHFGCACSPPVTVSSEPRTSFHERFPCCALEIAKATFNLIAERSHQVVRLLWRAKPFKVRMFEFEANSPTGAVVSSCAAGEHWFESSGNKIRFRWIGQLKFPQATRCTVSRQRRGPHRPD